MHCKYMTIEREYGSGGTRIARLLCEKTGVPCYGSEILEAVSEKYDISADRIQRYEESASGSVLNSIYMMTQSLSGSSDMLSREGYVYLAEQEMIRHLASSGRAIFLGHCACEALKDKAGLIKVFIRCTDEKIKHTRILEDYGIPEEEAEATRKKFDKKRSNYYHANTSGRWNDLRNYDIVLDSAVLGIEGCVSVLKGLF